MIENECLNYAYLAGIIDGDGSISIQKSKLKNGYSYQAKVIITGSTETIDWIKKNITNKVYINQSYNKKTFSLQIAKRENTLLIIDGILPYLVYKKHRAEIVRTFLLIKRGKTAIKERIFQQYRNELKIQNASYGSKYTKQNNEIKLPNDLTATPNHPNQYQQV